MPVRAQQPAGHVPAFLIPERMKIKLIIVDSFEVCAYSWCRKQPADILDHDPVGLQRVDRCRHMCPEAGTGAGLQTGHLPDGRYVLAEKPATEDVHWRHGSPVHGGDITKVRGLGPVVGEDAGDGLVDLGEPDRSGIEDFFADSAKRFGDLRACFGTFKIFNLDINSFVDAFPKVLDARFLKMLD